MKNFCIQFDKTVASFRRICWPSPGTHPADAGSKVLTNWAIFCQPTRRHNHKVTVHIHRHEKTSKSHAGKYSLTFRRLYDRTERQLTIYQPTPDLHQQHCSEHLRSSNNILCFYKRSEGLTSQSDLAYVLREHPGWWTVSGQLPCTKMPHKAIRGPDRVHVPDHFCLFFFRFQRLRGIPSSVSTKMLNKVPTPAVHADNTQNKRHVVNRTEKTLAI